MESFLTSKQIQLYMYLHTYHHVNIGNHIPSWQTFKPLTPIKINLIFSKVDKTHWYTFIMKIMKDLAIFLHKAYLEDLNNPKTWFSLISSIVGWLFFVGWMVVYNKLVDSARSGDLFNSFSLFLYLLASKLVVGDQSSGRQLTRQNQRRHKTEMWKFKWEIRTSSDTNPNINQQPANLSDKIREDVK